MVTHSGASIFKYKTKKTTDEILTKLDSVIREKNKTKCVLLQHMKYNDKIVGKCTYVNDPNDMELIPIKASYIVYPKYNKIIIIIANREKSQNIAETLIATIEHKPNSDDHFDKLKIPKEIMRDTFNQIVKINPNTIMTTAEFFYEDESIVELNKEYKEESYGKLVYTLSKNRSADSHRMFKELYNDASRFQMSIGIKTITGFVRLSKELTYTILKFTYTGRLNIAKDIDVQGWIKFFEHYLKCILEYD